MNYGGDSKLFFLYLVHRLIGISVATDGNSTGMCKIDVVFLHIFSFYLFFTPPPFISFYLFLICGIVVLYVLLYTGI